MIMSCRDCARDTVHSVGRTLTHSNESHFTCTILIMRVLVFNFILNTGQHIPFLLVNSNWLAADNEHERNNFKHLYKNSYNVQTVEGCVCV